MKVLEIYTYKTIIFHRENRENHKRIKNLRKKLVQTNDFFTGKVEGIIKGLKKF